MSLLKPLEDRKAELEANIEDAVIEWREELAAVEAEIAAHPATFEVADLDPVWVVGKVEEFVKRHFRRYPNNQGALTLSLKALLTGETTKYIP